MDDSDPEGLVVGDDLVIPANELRWRFDPSGGPGGQHANRSATRVELSFDVEGSAALENEQRVRLLRGLGRRATGGVVKVSVDETRSQYRNRRIAEERLAALLAAALIRPRRRRRTAPTAAARERRLRAKARRSETKRLRRPPDEV